MSLLCSLLPPSSSSSSSLPLPPPTRPSLPLPSSSSCYLCFLCFIFSVFFFPLALALSVVSRAHFASLLLPPLSFFALLASLLFFSSSITSSSSLLFLLTPPLTSFSLQTPLPLPLSSSPSIFPFYLSLSHDLNSSHHLSYFASYSALPSLLALLYMLSSSLPASLILLPDSTSPFLCIVYFPTLPAFHPLWSYGLWILRSHFYFTLLSSFPSPTPFFSSSPPFCPSFLHLSPSPLPHSVSPSSPLSCLFLPSRLSSSSHPHPAFFATLPWHSPFPISLPPHFPFLLPCILLSSLVTSFLFLLHLLCLLCLPLFFCFFFCRARNVRTITRPLQWERNPQLIAAFKF